MCELEANKAAQLFEQMHIALLIKHSLKQYVQQAKMA
jgi:hypothetical protein